MIGCLALIGVPVIIFVVMSAVFHSGVKTVSETNATSNSVQSLTPPRELEKRASSSSQEISSLSSAEKLIQGRKAYNERYFDRAKTYLNDITPKEPEYKQAQSLLKKMKNEEKKIDPQERNDAEKFRDSLQRLSDSIRNK